MIHQMNKRIKRKMKIEWWIKKNENTRKRTKNLPARPARCCALAFEMAVTSSDSTRMRGLYTCWRVGGWVSEKRRGREKGEGREKERKKGKGEEEQQQQQQQQKRNDVQHWKKMHLMLSFKQENKTHYFYNKAQSFSTKFPKTLRFPPRLTFCLEKPGSMT